MAGTQRVLYDDKETFQTSPLDEINKATAANYNELKDVINVNAQALDDILSITTGDVTAIQNTFTSDITAQTTGAGDPTFTGLDWTIDVTGRTSTGEVNFLDFKKTDTGTASVLKVDIDGNLTTTGQLKLTTLGLTGGIAFGDLDTLIQESTDGTLKFRGEGVDRFQLISSQNAFAGQLTAAPAMVNETTSLTNPTLLPSRSDFDTGVGGNNANSLALITGGITGLVVDASQNVNIDNGFLSINDTFLIKDAGTQTSAAGFSSLWADGDAVMVSSGTNSRLSLNSSTASLFIIRPDTTNADLRISPNGTGQLQLGGATSDLIGLYGVTGVAQAAAYTRTATIVEDRTLLASASATTINNNNVLAALIADLQALGAIG